LFPAAAANTGLIHTFELTKTDNRSIGRVWFCVVTMGTQQIRQDAKRVTCRLLDQRRKKNTGSLTAAAMQEPQEYRLFLLAISQFTILTG